MLPHTSMIDCSSSSDASRTSSNLRLGFFVAYILYKNLKFLTTRGPIIKSVFKSILFSPKMYQPPAYTTLIIVKRFRCPCIRYVPHLHSEICLILLLVHPVYVGVDLSS